MIATAGEQFRNIFEIVQNIWAVYESWPIPSSLLKMVHIATVTQSVGFSFASMQYRLAKDHRWMTIWHYAIWEELGSNLFEKNWTLIFIESDSVTWSYCTVYYNQNGFVDSGTLTSNVHQNVELRCITLVRFPLVHKTDLTCSVLLHSSDLTVLQPRDPRCEGVSVLDSGLRCCFNKSNC